MYTVGRTRNVTSIALSYRAGFNKHLVAPWLRAFRSYSQFRLDASATETPSTTHVIAAQPPKSLPDAKGKCSSPPKSAPPKKMSQQSECLTVTHTQAMEMEIICTFTVVHSINTVVRAVSTTVKVGSANMVSACHNKQTVLVNVTKGTARHVFKETSMTKAISFFTEHND